MKKEKLKARLTVTVTETEKDVHTKVQGLIDPDMDTMDRANIAHQVIKSLDITVTDVVMWWLADSKEEENEQ